MNAAVPEGEVVVAKIRGVSGYAFRSRGISLNPNLDNESLSGWGLIIRMQGLVIQKVRIKGGNQKPWVIIL